MKKLQLICLSFTFFIYCSKDDVETSFLETHSDKMWNLIDDSRYLSLSVDDEHIGFTYNNPQVLVYKTNFNNVGYGGICYKFKEGENIVQISECSVLNDSGFYESSESTIIFEVKENTQSILTLNEKYIDLSCESIIEINITRSYYISGDFLYENTVSDQIEYIRKYRLSEGSYDELCI